MSMSRWATNWIICRSRSASGVFSARSASAIVGLVIVVPPVGLVFANSTLPKPTVTPRKGRAIAGGARKPAPGYALRGFPSAIDLHHLQGHERRFAIGGQNGTAFVSLSGQACSLISEEQWVVLRRLLGAA